MNIAGYIASVFIGISLGLIGGGGSIFTVPVLVYLFHVDAVIATAYSLFIVGVTSVAGAASYLRKGLVHLKTAVIFGLPSIVAVFFTRLYILPAIPDVIGSWRGFVLDKTVLLLLLFALLMVLAAYGMIRKSSENAGQPHAVRQFNDILLLFQGVLVGLLTGLMGAGGGFLIIPTLVNLRKLPMKTAIGTSLVIIAVNSLAGFLFSLPHFKIHWFFVLSITVLAIAGIIAGSYIASKIDGRKLKPVFGWLVLVMGIYIIIRESLF